MLLLQEVKIHPEDRSTQAAVKKAVQPSNGSSAEDPSYVVEFCLPFDKHNARGFGRKVSGVCTIIREDFYSTYVERVRHVDWDAEGRFLVCETRAAGLQPKLAFINIYAVNGTDAAYKDSDTGEVVGTRHDRKLQVHRLLQAECRDLEARGFAVVLAGDINIARARIDGFPRLRESPIQHCKNRADFETKFFGQRPTREPSAEDQDACTDLRMIDSFRHLHPDRKGYTYYPRSQGAATFGASCDRVDMILLSHDLRDNLVSAGMHETVADRGTSDHVPLYCALQFTSQSSDGGVRTVTQDLSSNGSG
ncbi:unnamed protein product [Zymoseptoria tritici ST99CH_3D7]|uniref:Endonuclease/exonuclease/phosphatase domain-containing protein n=1 Tax=Zymoseptoria tritici (strain ST99CH_3D7) TaxID=1276538 RepID=A0A1X7RJD9_ZYMT9|nr:unnamed protein product [Zymoseptoria tritici ST99CH_3D7]